jgi:minor fimbrial subunit
MKMNILVLLMACATVLPALSADNVDIKVTGRIIAAPCVFNGGNSNMNIDLGNIQATNMFTPDLLPIRFLLTCCLPAVRRAR